MGEGLGKYFVLDLTEGEDGALCTEYLALAGMDIIRVEKPTVEREGETRARYIIKNLNKRYITLDTASVEGQRILQALALKADVIVENSGQDKLKNSRVDYKSVRTGNPGVVYISILPYASDSPWAGLPSDRSVISAMSGATYQCGQYGCEPVEPGGNLPDVTSCVFAATSAAAALYNRENTGEGKYIEINQMDSVIALDRSAYEKYLNNKINDRTGNLLLSCSPTGLYKTTDGEVAIMCLADPDFKPLCEAIGKPELADDPRFSNPKARVKNRAAIDAILSEWTAGLTKFEVMQRLLAERRVICSAVYTIEDLINSEDLRKMGLIKRVEDEKLGEMWIPTYTGVSDDFNLPAKLPSEVNADALSKEGRYGL
ncbi:MAG: hypothetical protein GXY20_10645 [Clostridiales bacterium]|nr:hypothetical protein [Clostridiales bacterium]